MYHISEPHCSAQRQVDRFVPRVFGFEGATALPINAIRPVSGICSEIAIEHVATNHVLILAIWRNFAYFTPISRGIGESRSIHVDHAPH